MNDSSIALYLHIPFCKQKCAYCDFTSYAGREADIARYCDALVCEIAAANRWHGCTVHSVFFGGGTPTLLAGEQITMLLDGLRKAFTFVPDVEITMEGNPGTLTRQNAALYRDAGVNRFSLGAQAKQPRLLEGLGRIHQWRDVEQSVDILREAGFCNINLDLMFGLPGQDTSDWGDTLQGALVLGPEHLSCYALQVEEGTPLAARCEALPDEDEERAMYALARSVLSGAGYAQYELSNFAKPGRECRQNLTYWTRGDYLGFGCAAHSLVGDQRWSNTPSLPDYLALESPMIEKTRLDAAEARFEALMLGLRLTEGVSAMEFAGRYGCDIQELWGERLVSLCENGLVEWAGERLRLTERGMDLQNAVLVALMD
ncbi:MAG: radical SAM family heme chaperone HemW [Clostridia bacterium]|nr:radical SAM family heme chaperone HemW [Clostridia bacterium]